MAPIDKNFFSRKASEVAEDLIGVTIVFNGAGGVIIETEAYDEEDESSHCYKEKTRNCMNDSMFLEPGIIYISPGRFMFNFNIVCQEKGHGSAVLIRAIKPIDIFMNKMQENRKYYESDSECNEKLLCAGPGPVTQALGINCNWNGKSIFCADFQIYRDEQQSQKVKNKVREGIRLEQDKKIAFYDACSIDYLSPAARKRIKADQNVKV